MKGIRVSEAINNLRTELTQAIEEGKDEKVKYKVDAINLELQVEVGHEASAGGGISWWVFSADAKASRTDSRVHTLKLTLQPEAAIRVSRRRKTRPR